MKSVIAAIAMIFGSVAADASEVTYTYTGGPMVLVDSSCTTAPLCGYAGFNITAFIDVIDGVYQGGSISGPIGGNGILDGQVSVDALGNIVSWNLSYDIGSSSFQNQGGTGTGGSDYFNLTAWINEPCCAIDFADYSATGGTWSPTFASDPPAPVPLPTTLPLFLGGLFVMRMLHRKRSILRSKRSKCTDCLDRP